MSVFKEGLTPEDWFEDEELEKLQTLFKHFSWLRSALRQKKKNKQRIFMEMSAEVQVCHGREKCLVFEIRESLQSVKFDLKLKL